MWVDDPQLNLDYHVRHTALPPPGSEEQLGRSRRGSSPSAWTAPSRSGRCGWSTGSRAAASRSSTRCHHCLVDGVSGVDITTVLFDLDREPAEPASPEPWLPRAGAQRRAAPGRGAPRARDKPGRDGPRRPRRGAAPRRCRAAAKELEAAGSFARTGSRRSDSPFNRAIGPYRRFAWVRSDLAELKRIKNIAGGTVNDVVLAGGVRRARRYLRGRGHSTKELELGRWCRSASGPTTSTARSATGSRR